MYESFYGLRQPPFDVTTNPAFLVLTGKHREALSNLVYGIRGRKGLTVLIGQAGTGKTTLIQALPRYTQSVTLVCVSNPVLTRAEFLELLAAGFSLSPEAGVMKSRFLLELSRAAAERRKAGGTLALIIDEAHSAPPELLEEVRLLANVETATEKLLPLVLCGQPELGDRLNDSSLSQLKQRVALRCQLPPLDADETQDYITQRIRLAGGGDRDLFTPEAVRMIYERSGGIPRLISVICDNALITGFAADCRRVDRDIIDGVCRDFDQLGPCGGGPTLESAAFPRRFDASDVRAHLRPHESTSGPETWATARRTERDGSR